MADDERKIAPGAVLENLSVSKEYELTADPDRVAVTPGAIVRYTCVTKDGRYAEIAGGNYWGLRDDFTWYKFRDRSIVRHGDGKWLDRKFTERPVFAWDCEWTEEEGKYVIGCEIYNRLDRSKTWCFLGQHVDDVEIALFRFWLKTRKRKPADPATAVAYVDKLISVLRQAAEKFPPADEAGKKAFADSIKRREEYRDALVKKLKSTENMHRYPIRAAHLAVAHQDELALNVFIVPMNTPGSCTWKLVDWTDPTRNDICQEFEATGDNDREAVQNLMDSWNSSHNRYPPGMLKWQIDLNEIQLSGHFETNGQTRWDIVSGILGKIALAGAVVAGVATLIAPVPGSQVASCAIWTSILSSTAAAAINIYQREEQGYGTATDNIIDGLTIVGNLLAGVGQVARVAQFAKAGGWAAGAEVTYNTTAGKVLRYTLIGQIGNDCLQGVLVLSEEMKEYNAIMSDQTLTPDQRVERLMAWIQRVGVTGAMTMVSVKYSKAELETLNAQNSAIKNGKQFGADENLIKPLKEKLDQLGDPNAKVTIDEKVPVEGKVPEAKPVNEIVTHKTKAEVEMVSPELAAPKAEPAKAPKKLSKGAALAQKKGYPPAEKGYHWAVDKNGNLVYRRNAGNTAPAREYDPQTGAFRDVPGQAPVRPPEKVGWKKGQVPCFPAGELVHTPSGCIPIEKVQVGDEVYALDLVSRQLVQRKVTGVHHGTTQLLVHIRKEDTLVTATARHLFWEANSRQWMESRSIAGGSTLLSLNLQTVDIHSVVIQPLRETVDTYNLSVEGTNNFFAGATGLLVHNEDTPLDAPGYKNYVLRDKDGNIYYAGMYGPNETQADVEYRHANNNNRFDPEAGDTMETLPGDRTYGESRRMEHELCVDNDTYIGKDGDNYRGNRQYPLSERNYDKYYDEDAC